MWGTEASDPADFKQTLIQRVNSEEQAENLPSPLLLTVVMYVWACGRYRSADAALVKEG